MALLLQSATLFGADYIRWHDDSKRVDAHLSGWKMARVVQEVARQSGWEVYAEAGLTATVDTQFENQPVGRALELMLGRLNFATLPGRDGVMRLYIFETSAQAARVRVLVPQQDPAPMSMAVQAALRRLEGERLAQSHRLDPAEFGTNAVAELSTGLRSPDPEIRAASASALGFFDTAAASAIDPLIEAMDDEDLKVQLNATMSLGQLGQAPERVLPSYLERLNDPSLSSVARAWTVSAIARFEPLPDRYADQLRSLLESGLQDSSRMVRAHCREALGRL